MLQWTHSELVVLGLPRVLHGHFRVMRLKSRRDTGPSCSLPAAAAAAASSGTNHLQPLRVHSLLHRFARDRLCGGSTGAPTATVSRVPPRLCLRASKCVDGRSAVSHSCVSERERRGEESRRRGGDITWRRHAERRARRDAGITGKQEEEEPEEQEEPTCYVHFPVHVCRSLLRCPAALRVCACTCVCVSVLSLEICGAPVLSCLL